MQTRLYRSRKHRVIGGVCGGLAEYFNTDPVAIRLAWLFLVLVGGTGVLLYILAWIIMPDEKAVRGQATTSTTQAPPESEVTTAQAGESQEGTVAKETAEPEYHDTRGRTRIGGAILIAAGAYFLIDRLVYFDLSAWWPVLLIVAGVALLVSSKDSSPPAKDNASPASASRTSLDSATTDDSDGAEDSPKVDGEDEDDLPRQ
ncbi:MAG: PspC domain-containing protein [Bacillota bacterium]